MNIKLENVPFSTKGSYMAISICEENFRGFGLKRGLYLRSVHGNSRFPFIGELIPLLNGKPCKYQAYADPYVLYIEFNGGIKLEIVFSDADTILVASTNKEAGIRIDTLAGKSGFNCIQPVRAGEKNWYLLNSFKSYTRYMLFNQQGGITIKQNWVEDGASESVVDFTASAGGLLAVIQEVADVWKESGSSYDFVIEKQKAKTRWEYFYERMPQVSAEYEEGRKIAAYVNYSCYVNPKGFLKRPAMLMSKNWMTKLWSWDHCFNSLALARYLPEEAWDQFMLPFDLQSSTGRIPDSIEDSLIIDNYCKPPIHGWTLRKLRKMMCLNQKKLEEAYEKIGLFTRWWLNYRDQDGDGLCEYTHGNDSGWDNSTAFSMLPPVVTPDLATFLIIQMEELASVASRLGRERDASEWRQASDAMMKKMLETLFVENQPVSRQALTGKIIPNDSLILYLPVLLGKRLPLKIRKNLIQTLKSDKFLTEYGWATESPASRYYQEDGYWRGPIWAPSTFLLLDGVWECGEEAFARNVAERFCKMVSKEGCAENFNALTGKALRDKAYTWTGSAMLVIAQEYLSGCAGALRE